MCAADRLSTPVIESLATAGAFDCFGLDRKKALCRPEVAPSG